MSAFIVTLEYPGVLPVTSDSIDGPFEHPSLVDARLDFDPALGPLLLPEDTGDEQGTFYRFQTVEYADHHRRAWRTVGWKTIRITGTVRFPTNSHLSAGHEPWTAWYGMDVEYTLPSSITKQMHDSVAGLTSDGPPAHAGVNLGTGHYDGELQTNVGLPDSATNWVMSSASPTDWTVISNDVVDTINEWTADGITFVAAHDVYLKIEATAFGNSGLIRYRSGEDHDGPWVYCTLCSVGIRATLRCPGAGEGGVIIEGADGSHDADVNVGPWQDLVATTHTLIGVAGEDKDTAIISGEVTFNGGYAMTPDMTLYSSIQTGEYRLPWAVSGEFETVYERPEFADLVVEFDDFEKAVLPADL